jgi:hypothetical protein
MTETEQIRAIMAKREKTRQLNKDTDQLRSVIMTETKKPAKTEQIRAKYDRRIAEMYQAKQKALEAEKAERERKKAEQERKKTERDAMRQLSLFIGKFYTQSIADGTTNAVRLLTKIQESLKEGSRDRLFIERQITYFKNQPKRRTKRIAKGGKS